MENSKNFMLLAKGAYQDCINDLRKMAKLMDGVVSQRGIDYEPKSVLRDFDILLQYSMLQVAVADDILTKDEIQFIQNITAYGDFCTFLSAVAKYEITWEGLYYSDESDIKSVLNDMNDIIHMLAKTFITTFAVVDSATEYNYLADLKRNVTIMILATCKADGEIEDSEFSNGCLIIDIVEEIENRKNTLK